MVAPLAVPVLTALTLGVRPNNFGGAVIIVFGAGLGYLGAFVFGLPLYFFLVRRGATSFWIAAALGLLVGAIMSQVFFGVFGPFAGLWGGTCGAVVGMIIWAIARPDLRARNQAPGAATDADDTGTTPGSRRQGRALLSFDQ